jgi:dual specificity protein kinase YAK1
MANRTAFIDFAQGLLNLNPLERWTPNQAKAHPFITQNKFTGPFVPPMTMRTGSNKSPAPGVQEQQRAEAMSKQRQQQQQQQQQAAQAQQQQQAQTAAYASMQMGQYGQSPLAQQPPTNMYNMYSPSHQQGSAPPPYQQPAGYARPTPDAALMPSLQAPHQPRYQPQQPNNLYAQAATRAGRQRASTMEHQQPTSGIPAALQRVMGHLDPNAPIRLQPSPAYYPPPPDGAPDSAGRQPRRGSRAGNNGQRGNRDFIRTLEDRTLEEGFMNSNSHHWQ